MEPLLAVLIGPAIAELHTRHSFKQQTLLPAVSPVSPPSLPRLPPAVCSQVTQGLAGAIRSVDQISGLLSGGSQAQASDAAAGSAHVAVLPSAPAIHKAALDIEKQQLHDEVRGCVRGRHHCMLTLLVRHSIEATAGTALPLTLPQKSVSFAVL